MYPLIRTILIAACLACAATAFAQSYKEVPAEQRDAMFLYAEVELIGSNQPKILLVSSYIYRYVYEYPAYNVYDRRPRNFDSWRNIISNTVSRKREKINRDEHHKRAENPANQVNMKYHEIGWSYWNKGIAGGNNNISHYNTYKSTLEFCRAARRQVIEKYRMQNYTVIQFNVIDVAEEDYFKLDIEKVDKLSHLEFAEYYPGQLKEIAWPYYQRYTEPTKTKTNEEPVVGGVCSGHLVYVRTEYERAKKAGNDITAWQKVQEACNYYTTYCGNTNAFVTSAYSEASRRIQQSHQQMGEAVLLLMGDRSEVSGSFSFKDAGNAQGMSLTKPIEFYSHQEVRVTWVHGGKHLKFTLSPLAFTWLYLPTHSKFDPSTNSQIERGDWGDVRFYTPSLGLVYSFFGKKQKENLGRSFEMPLTLQYIFLWSPHTSSVNDDMRIGDSEFKEYFDTKRYMARATLGMEFFFGKGFGMGFSAGINYVDIKQSSATLTDNVNGYQRKFNLKIDELKKYYPVAELKLILRNNAYNN